MMEGFIILWWHWCVFGLVLLCLELLVPGTFFLWFGIGALATGMLCALLSIASWQTQALIFTALSLVAMILGRSYMNKRNPPEASTLNKRLLQFIGRTAELERAIVNGEGRIRLGDTFWLVRGQDAPVGTQVTVTGAEGSHLLVQTATESTGHTDAGSDK